jgi:hypothetical protein
VASKSQPTHTECLASLQCRGRWTATAYACMHVISYGFPSGVHVWHITSEAIGFHGCSSLRQPKKEPIDVPAFRVFGTAMRIIMSAVTSKTESFASVKKSTTVQVVQCNALCYTSISLCTLLYPFFISSIDKKIMGDRRWMATDIHRRSGSQEFN